MARSTPPEPAPITSIGSRLEPVPHACIGWVAGATPEGLPLVDFEGNAAGPLPAASIPAAGPAELLRSAATRRPVALLFDRGDPLRPIVVGFLTRPPSAELPGPAPLPSVVVEVDGRRLAIEGKDEIVLRCGEASIALRRNGKIVIRGTDLESRSSGRHRIRGGTIELN